MDVLVLADTHLRADAANRLPAAVHEALAHADVVLHAGDVVSREALDLFGSTADLRAVLGNNDAELIGVLPSTRQLELAGVQVAMLHDAGPRRGRAARLHRRFPGADVVVFGHSHEPCDEPGIGGQLLFNPGSPTQRRRQPVRTLGWLRLSDGRIEDRLIEPV